MNHAESWDVGARPVARQARVGAEVAHAMAKLIVRYADPRLALVTVTGVDMSPDLKQARILVSSVNPAADVEGTLIALRHAATRLRHELAREVHLRTLPWLKFAWDYSTAERDRLDDLIARGLPREGDSRESAAGPDSARDDSGKLS